MRLFICLLVLFQFLFSSVSQSQPPKWKLVWSDEFSKDGTPDVAKWSFRAINKRTGQILFETDLPATGASTSAVYSVKGKEYVVIACGGSKWGGKKSDAYVAFSLPVSAD